MNVKTGRCVPAAVAGEAAATHPTEVRRAAGMLHPLSTVVITSYGAAHHDVPQATRPVTVDASLLPQPDAMSRAGQQLGGRSPAARAYVTRSPAGRLVVDQALERIRQRLGPGGQVAVHVRSPHGHYRAPAVAEEIADQLRASGVQVQVIHRHLGRPDPPATH
ncbi:MULTISPECIES: RapZ C-terminal domain-containing protein [Streptomyces]|nr:hypothetical protein [Streptomyces rimosus]MYT42023.1 hypothetical protein [Streptomyces sp. SID5471]QGY70879.1 hypothetical protein V519_037800 [Streptomyces rimosus R6-500]